MKKELLILITGYSISVSLIAQTPNWSWAESSEINGSDKIGYDIGADAISNLYTVGEFKDTLEFGATQLLATAGTVKKEIFISKHDSLGNFIWAIQSDGGSQPSALAVFTDNAGNSYVTGSFQNTITVGALSESSTNNFGRSMFIMKIDANGTPLFMVSYAAPAPSFWDAVEGSAITVSNGGTIYIGGNYKGGIDFGNSVTLSNPSLSAPFAAAFDASGNALWATGGIGGSTTGATVGGIGINQSSGDVYTTGSFKSGMKFNPTDSLIGTSNTDLFIAKYNSSGTCSWAKMPGVTGSFSAINKGADVGVDGNGDVYFTGYFKNDVTFGTTTLSAGSFDDCTYLAKYDANGTNIWAKQVGDASSANIYATAMIVGNDGNSYITGSMSAGSVNFASGSLSTGNGDVGDLFILNFDASGSEQWATKALDTVPGAFGLLGDGANGIVSTGSGIYITGFYQSNLAFDNSIIAEFEGGKNMFIAKLGASVVSGIEDNLKIEDNLSVYPNPFSDRFILKNPDQTKLSINLIDLTGKILQSFNSNKNNIEVNQSNLPKGIYFLNARNLDSGVITTTKIIKQ